MLHLVPRFGFFLAALSVGAANFGLTSLPGADTATGEIEELRRLASELGLDLEESAWQLGGGLEAGIGYSDNVRLAAVDPVSSGFARFNLGGVAMRLPRGGVEWFNSVDGVFTRYFERDIDNAIFALGRSEVRWRPHEAVQFSAAGQFVHQDEVIDASSLDLGANHLQVRVTSLSFEPAVQWTFARGWIAGVELSAAKDNFHDLDDHDEIGTEFTLTRDSGRWGSWTFAAGRLARDYATRPQTSIGGGSIDNTILGITQTRYELRYAVKGDTTDDGLRWRVKATAGSLDNADNGEGWYDYTRHHVQANLGLEGTAWRLEGSAGWRRYVYRVQYAGFGIDPPRRKREEWSWSARYERDLRAGLSAFVEVEWERSLSNDEFLRYRSTTAVLGLHLNH